MVENKPDIVSVIGSEITLTKKGSRYYALCPYHSEKTPSFIVNSDKQTFHCFGCLAHGDSIHFIQKLHNLSFPEALSYLGIEQKKLSPRKYREVQKQKEIKSIKKELGEIYREWEKDFYTELCELCREFDLLKLAIKTEADLDRYAWLYLLQTDWKFWLEILRGENDKLKYGLYRKIGNNFEGHTLGDNEWK